METHVFKTDPLQIMSIIDTALILYLLGILFFLLIAEEPIKLLISLEVRFRSVTCSALATMRLTYKLVIGLLLFRGIILSGIELVIGFLLIIINKAYTKKTSNRLILSKRLEIN